tara:strand:+ start:2046 stop:3245 length:1200 start_codon:yes stop_codon:yes gene_type:complete
MKDLEYFNRLIEDVVVHVDGLIVEQSEKEDYEQEKTDAELIQDIIDASESNPNEDVDVQQLFDDLEEGEFRKAFGVEEADIDRWFREHPNVDYVIEGGKQVGKTISKTTYTAIRTFRAQAQARKFASQNTLKKLISKEGTKSYCHCLKLVRTFIDMDDPSDEATKCPEINRAMCRSNFETSFNAEIATLNSYDREIQEKHYDDCLEKYGGFRNIGKKLWSLNYRQQVDKNQQCKKWDKNIKQTVSDIMSKLTSMASEWFVTTQDFKKKMSTEGDSIAAKLIVFDKIRIKFDDDVFDPNNSSPPPPACPSGGSTFPNCVPNSEKLDAGEYTFEPLSASPFSKGNTVMFAHGSYRMLMTFKNSTRLAPNSGSLTFYTKSTATSAESPKVKWKGTITRMDAL